MPVESWGRDRDRGGAGWYSRMQGGSEGAGSRRAIALGAGSARDRLRLPGWFRGRYKAHSVEVGKAPAAQIEIGVEVGSLQLVTRNKKLETRN